MSNNNNSVSSESKQEDIVKKYKAEIKKFFLLKERTRRVKRWLLPALKSFSEKLEACLPTCEHNFLKYNFQYLLNTVEYLLKSAKVGENFGCAEVGYFEDIFDLLIKSFSEKPSNEEKFKIICYMILHNSKKDKKIYTVFDSCKLLYMALNTIYTNFEELNGRGYKSSVFYDYANYIYNEEIAGKHIYSEEKYQIFLDILYGKSLFVPMYKKVMVGYTVIKDPKENAIILQDEDNDYHMYGLPPINK